MIKIGLGLLLIIFFGCSLNNSQEIKHRSYQELVFLLATPEPDSLSYDEYKSDLIKYYPESEKVFELANAEFYDRIYPIWQNDSSKVEVISELLEKYPATNWRRTMYQYLTYSLHNLKDVEKLEKALGDFRVAFPDDYLPFELTARYYYLNDYQLEIAELFAEKASIFTKHYPKLDFFPPMEWELEERFASIKTAAVLAEIKLKLKKYQEAINLLNSVIKENQLGVDDENTLGRCYYLLAKAYQEMDRTEDAVDAALQALVAGDSRNYYAPQADSLFKEMIGYMDLSEPEYDEFCRERAGYRDVKFTDITKNAGLENIQAGRVAWADFNEDGFVDLLLDGSRLFQNEKGKKFVEITVDAFPDTIRGNGGLWGDFDNDGDLDIVTKDPESIWLNEAGKFKKVTGANSLQNNQVSTEGVGIGDVNNDGFLDVYLANYEVWKDNSSESEFDKFYKGKGDGTFVDVTDRAGMYPSFIPKRAGRGVNMSDFDNDGDLDIFVSNYRLQPNFLWVNDGSGHFDDLAKQKGVAGAEVEGWWGHTIGSEWGDLDNDGDLDLFCANLAHPRYIDFSNMSMLYLNSGKPDWTFEDNRRNAGIRYEETHSEPCLADFNNDGFLDIYINCVYEGRRSFLYMNNGDGNFREVTFLAGVRHFNGWGNAAADFDNDGDLDLLAAGGTIQLFRNETNKSGNWLEVKILGSDHSDAIGTRLELSNDNISLLREIQGGKGTTNQHSLVQHFGLGKNQPPFNLQIRFSNGEKKLILVKEINRVIKVVQ
ncbi:MAG: FG-GAP-like repeat-containing protein [Candidatus Cloacimonadales bacterium]|nr:FG-GAP-like repeat-containing protein [Candidatus Cloacimonadales bacterium]